MGNERAIIAEAAEPYRHLLTVDEFLILDEAGAFENVGRVELIEGEIFVMAPLHRQHARTLMQLSVAVSAAVDRIQGVEALTPVSAHLDEHSLPEADIVIADVVDEKLVTAPYVRLLIEVADTSLGHDLGRKLKLYARSSVPEYWVADVNGRQIFRFHAPEADGFAEQAIFAFGECIASATIEGLVVDTRRLA